jgi:carboxylesterase type B
MVKALMHAWASFAKDPQNGLTGLGWPLYHTNNPMVMQLGGPNSAKISSLPREKFDRYGPVGLERQC